MHIHYRITKSLFRDYMDVYKNHSSKYIRQKWEKDSDSQIT